MFANRIGKLALGLAAMVAFNALQSQVASAQGNRIKSTAERRQSGGFWANQRASRNIQHALTSITLGKRVSFSIMHSTSR